MALIFLEINFYQFSAPEVETLIIIEALAAGKVSETELSVWLEQYPQEIIT